MHDCKCHFESKRGKLAILQLYLCNYRIRSVMDWLTYPNPWSMRQFLHPVIENESAYCQKSQLY